LRSVFWSKFGSPGYSQFTGKPDRTSQERGLAAIEKWLKVEERNACTNARIELFQVNFGKFSSEDVLQLASKYLMQTIGKVPPRDLLGEYTGGASTRVKRSPYAIPQKFEGKAHVSRSAELIAGSLFLRYPLWGRYIHSQGGYEYQDASVLFTVPKNSEIDRVACKEPEVNMYLQRACGLFIRNRLKRAGIDLQDQSRNRRLAKIGSSERKLATMDLSSASDTVSTALVRRLLPPAWFELLDALRVKKVDLPDGTQHTLEMFSSMGNGFTFELESLIFWVLTRSVAALIKCRGSVGVYGDDIIAPIGVAKSLLRVLPFFGFIVNQKKTFVSGDFRESCGGHYRNGRDVTPVYFRKEIASVTECIQLCNQLLKWCATTPLGVVPSKGLADLILGLIQFVPARFHGGQSFERIDALVTGDSPKQRLVQVHKPVDIPMVGGYLWWLHEKEMSPRVHSPTEAATEGRWVVRPNQSWYEGDLMLRVKHEIVSGLTYVSQYTAPYEPVIRGFAGYGLPI